MRALRQSAPPGGACRSHPLTARKRMLGPHRRSARCTYAQSNAGSGGGSATPAPASAAALKDEVKRLAGSKYGHDKDEATKAEICSTLDQLAQLPSTAKASTEWLAGTLWRPLFTTSKGTSSGQVGPFVAYVEQDFPGSEPGVYYNVLRLGLVEARLRGVFDLDSDRNMIDLEFEWLGLSIGPWKNIVKKEFEKGQMRGFWKLRFTDDDFRLFNTNKDNVFVLTKV